MKIYKKIIGVLLILSVTISSIQANAVESFVGGLIGGIVGSTQTHKQTYRKQTYRKKTHRKKTHRKKTHRKKSVPTIPSYCSSEQWTAQVINNSVFATNFQGIFVTQSNNNLIIKLEIKNPIPSMFRAGDTVQVLLKFNGKNKTTNAILDKNGRHLIISGIDSNFITEKLKKSSYINVEFVNNKYCSRLKGSGNAIKTVESSLSYKQNNTTSRIQSNVVRAAAFVAPLLTNSDIDKARLVRATTEHMNHAQRVASNQKEFAEKMIGIRPKSDLDAADGNINDVKIQYYIPGSEEIGEMWINWHIDDEKGPMMRLHFMDPTHIYKTEAHEVDISLEPIKAPCNTDINIKSNEETSPSCKIIKDMLIADKWAKIAKKAEMKRRYRKIVSYINGNKDSKKSLAVYFQVYENGAMTVQLEEMNHGFPKRFNFTFAQALELSKYIESTRKKAHRKWMNKTRTKEDLDAMFK